LLRSRLQLPGGRKCLTEAHASSGAVGRLLDLGLELLDRALRGSCGELCLPPLPHGVAEKCAEADDGCDENDDDDAK